MFLFYVGTTFRGDHLTIYARVKSITLNIVFYTYYIIIIIIILSFDIAPFPYKHAQRRML